MSSTASRIVVALSGLFGAAGTALAALASHGGDPRLLGIAAAMLLVHAPALLALALAPPGTPRLRGLACAALALGVALFAGDLAARHVTGGGLPPGAAPAGGASIIAGWLLVALGATLPAKPEV